MGFKKFFRKKENKPKEEEGTFSRTRGLRLTQTQPPIDDLPNKKLQPQYPSQAAAIGLPVRYSYLHSQETPGGNFRPPSADSQQRGQFWAPPPAVPSSSRRPELQNHSQLPDAAKSEKLGTPKVSPAIPPRPRISRLTHSPSSAPAESRARTPSWEVGAGYDRFNPSEKQESPKSKPFQLPVRPGGAYPTGFSPPPPLAGQRESAAEGSERFFRASSTVSPTVPPKIPLTKFQPKVPELSKQALGPASDPKRTIPVASASASVPVNSRTSVTPRTKNSVPFVAQNSSSKDESSESSLDLDLADLLALSLMTRSGSGTPSSQALRAMVLAEMLRKGRDDKPLPSRLAGRKDERPSSPRSESIPTTTQRGHSPSSGFPFRPPSGSPFSFGFGKADRDPEPASQLPKRYHSAIPRQESGQPSGRTEAQSNTQPSNQRLSSPRTPQLTNAQLKKETRQPQSPQIFKVPILNPQPGGSQATKPPAQIIPPQPDRASTRMPPTLAEFQFGVPAPPSQPAQPRASKSPTGPFKVPVLSGSGTPLSRNPPLDSDESRNEGISPFPRGKQESRKAEAEPTSRVSRYSTESRRGGLGASVSNRARPRLSMGPRDPGAMVLREPGECFTEEQVKACRIEIWALLDEKKTLNLWNSDRQKIIELAQDRIKKMIERFFEARESWTSDEWSMLLAMAPHLRRHGIAIQTPQISDTVNTQRTNRQNKAEATGSKLITTKRPILVPKRPRSTLKTPP